MRIEKAVEVTDELLSALSRLIFQLAPEKTPPTRDDLTSILNSPGASLLVARLSDENDGIAGILTLIVYRVPIGARAVIEDVVVDEKYRNKGIAKAMMTRAIELAREAGASNISLTSNPKREAANLLYQRMGFQKRETNLYILHL
ncbi:MAG: GNAT family N-acetyltransferase [Anaerolineales bacterium]